MPKQFQQKDPTISKAVRKNPQKAKVERRGTIRELKREKISENSDSLVERGYLLPVKFFGFIIISYCDKRQRVER